jgi:hypothetical protein
MSSITMYQGDSLVIEITVKDAITGLVFSLLGCTAKFEIAKQVTSTPLVQLSSAAGDITLTDPVNGVMEVKLLPTHTETLTPGRYYYEAEITDDSGDISTVVAGQLTINRTLIK